MIARCLIQYSENRGMSLNIGVVMDPIQSIHYQKDTTLALLWAAQDRGATLFYIEPDGLFLEGDAAMARAATLTEPASRPAAQRARRAS